jgi:Fur family peroxide stress response transcriptional regulator
MDIHTQTREKLTKAGLKATHQRIVILESIQKMKNHPTAEYIYEQINPEFPTISLGTLYKNLETFVEKGLVAKVSTKEGQMRYDPRTDSHGHIHCSNTREIIDYYDEELNDLIVQFFKSKRISNLHIKNITLNINANRIDPDKEISIK